MKLNYEIGSQKRTILEAMCKGHVMTSMSGFRLGIVRLTNRCNEMIENGVPIQKKELKIDNVRFMTYFLTKKDQSEIGNMLKNK